MKAIKAHPAKKVKRVFLGVVDSAECVECLLNSLR